jgi:hypothetical protein
MTLQQHYCPSVSNHLEIIQTVTVEINKKRIFSQKKYGVQLTFWNDFEWLYKDTYKVFTVSVYFPITTHNSVNVQLITYHLQDLKRKLGTEIHANTLTVTKHF